MAAILMLVICFGSSCEVHELEVEARVCQTASYTVAQAWVAAHRPGATIQRIRCAMGRRA